MTIASMPFEYAEIDIPETAGAGGRPKEKNPHGEIVEYLAAHVADKEVDGKPHKQARMIAVPATVNTDGTVDEAATDKDVSKHTRWLREVGTDARPSYSVRTGKVQNAVKGKGTKADPHIPVRVITFWIHTADGKPARIERKNARK